MTSQVSKTERGVSVSHCVIVQCPPLAKNPHLKEQQVLWKVTLQNKNQKIHSKPPQKQCQIIWKCYYIMVPIYPNPRLALLLHSNRNTLGAEINPEVVFLRSLKLDMTIQK